MKKTKSSYTSRAAAVELLEHVLEQGAYANIVVGSMLRRHEFTDEERRFLTELVYGTVKAVGTLDWYIDKCVARDMTKLDSKILNILRISFFQLLDLPRIPEAVVCNEAVILAHKFSHKGAAGFVNGVLRNFLRQKESAKFSFPARADDEAGHLALLHRHPRWLVKKWLGQFGVESTEKLLSFNNEAAPICLRANTLCISARELLRRLQDFGAEAELSAWCPDGIVCTGGLPSMNKVLQELPREFYVQDESSMLVASLAGPRAGETVIDLCAAPGGKSTHAAQLMRNRGKIFSCDVHQHKLDLLQNNADRLGISIIETVLQDGTVFVDEWKSVADLVLVDAPCSGLGVLRRRAEARWIKKKKDLKIFPSLQLRLLINAAAYVKPGGRLVYSTCTIEPAENHYVIENFLAQEKNWRRRVVKHPLTGKECEELQLLPQADHIDGFFICVLERDL